MAETKSQEQPQQAGESSRAPQSAFGADAPRLERPAPKSGTAAEERPRPLRDWASI